jgi:hypothetical protein
LAKKVKGKNIAPWTPGDPTDHSTSASAIAGQLDPTGKAQVQAKSVDKATAKAEEAEAAKPEDDSLLAKILKSELFFVRDHNTGEEYVGISPQNDPEASRATKIRSLIAPLGTVAPRTGMQVRPKDGKEFAVGEGFGPTSTPDDWAKVTSPDGKALFG